VFAVYIFSYKKHTVKFGETLFPGTYNDFISGNKVELKNNYKLELEPWGYKVFFK
jgi:hypothetical protein